MANESKDQPVLGHIDGLVKEEERLYSMRVLTAPLRNLHSARDLRKSGGPMKAPRSKSFRSFSHRLRQGSRRHTLCNCPEEVFESKKVVVYSQPG
jgi:hypothetical protein